MSDTELPQPIYPPGGGPATGHGSAGGGYGATPGAGGPSVPGSGSGAGGSGGSNLDPRLLIGIVVAAVLVIGGVVFALTRSKGEGGTKAGDTTRTTSAPTTESTARRGTIADTTVTTLTATTDGASDLKERAQNVAAVQLDAAGPEAVACMADGFAASPTLLDTIEPMADAVSFDDPALATEFARIVVSCATVDELLTEFETLLVSEGVQSPELDCVLFNLSTFGSTQWQEFLATGLQPSEASYTQQVIAGLAVC